MGNISPELRATDSIVGVLQGPLVGRGVLQQDTLILVLLNVFFLIICPSAVSPGEGSILLSNGHFFFLVLGVLLRVPGDRPYIFGHIRGSSDFKSFLFLRV